MDLNFQEELFAGRDEFLGYMRSTIGLYQVGNTTTHFMVKRLILSMARPEEHDFDVNNSVHFAVSRGVRHLELDFYPRRDQYRFIDPAHGFRLPEAVYHHHPNLHSLKLVWCKFDVARLKSFNSLVTLTLAWVTVTTNELRDLVGSCPILKTLRLQFCTVLNALEISVPGNCALKNLVVERCNIGVDLFVFVGPGLRKFVYTGKVARFLMGNQSELIEARLDFGEQLEFRTGIPLSELLEQLVSVRTMSVCSVFLQMIAGRNRNNRVLDLNPSYRTISDLNVQHLTMNTGLHANEFIGIKFMLASCPRMNTLDMCLSPGKILTNYKGPYKITSSVDFWREPARPEACLRESLLVLNVHGFRGTNNQMMFIGYIIRYGHCLRSVNLYIPQTCDPNFILFLQGKATELGGGAHPVGLEISVLTPSLLVNRIVLPHHY